MIIETVFAAAIAFTPQEKELDAKLPEIFAKAAEHYRALDAAATPLHELKEAKTHHGEDVSKYVFPHGFRRQTRELDMRSIYWWTSGHFPGSLWYLHEATGDEKLRERAEFWTGLVAPNSKVTSNHDVGFIMYCSYGNARRILKTEKFDKLLVETAESLCRRYSPELGLIRSWGAITNRDDFLVIPDNMMNLELLEAAARISGNRRFAEIAESHADRSMANHFREDGGCYHVLNYDRREGFLGTVKEIRRGQGLSCRTAWSRGQAWGIYGYTMMYRMTGLRRYLDFAMKLADYAINHPNMPADGVPYWDFGAPGEERDTSAASIMASALLELSTYCGNPNTQTPKHPNNPITQTPSRRYRTFAVKQLAALSSPEYFSEGDEIGHFLLKHGVGAKPSHSEVDTPLDYGDYYYLEALLRFRRLMARDRELETTAAKLPAKPGLPADEYEYRFQASNSRGDFSKEFAEKALAAPIPDTSDALYREFGENGNRSHYEKPYFLREHYLDVLAVVEARERKGRYLARIEDYLRTICDMKAWTLPAHDGALDNFRGDRQTVALFSSQYAAHLAVVLQLVGDRIDPALRARVAAEVERRIFAPLRRDLGNYTTQGADERFVAARQFHWWIDSKYNWNAVCWNNVVCAALWFLDDPLDRAYFVDGALKSVPTFLGGFTSDGYCLEGMGYWNYGYGYHLMMARLLKKVTDGAIDLAANPRERVISGYGRGNAFDLATAPKFADGSGAPSAAVLRLVDEFWPDLPKDFAPSTAFPSAQTWLFRDPEGISAAIKGGDNGVAHNHNDLGSYDVYLRGKKIGGDPDLEQYTARTFSKDRYVSKVLNSYGHPVPVVGGRLQSTGAKFRAKVLSAKIDDAGVSEVAMELKGAYECPTLKSLVRTFRYDRKAKAFTVVDRVEFTEPTAFEDAYVTFREKDNPGRKDIGWDVRPEVAVKGASYTSREETIDNPGRLSPVRVGIALDKPVTAAEITFIYR